VRSFARRTALAALRTLGLETIRLPGVERHLLVTSSRTRRAVGGDLLLFEHLAWLLARYRVDTVLDVGANAGQFGSELRRAGYRGRILSFEPMTASHARLRAAAAGDAAWTTLACALGRTDGEAELNVTRHDVFASFRAPVTYAAARFGEATAVARRERVVVRRLDGVLDEVLGPAARARCFLKMDTQGFDLEVFDGVGVWLDRVVALQSEVAVIPLYDGAPRLTESIARYEREGFEVTGLFPVSRDEATGRVIEFDCVMARPAALAA
jgi:FkbM family methyltransferase